MTRLPASATNPADMVYVGFHGQVCALNRDTGLLLWSWTAPHGSGFVATLFDGDRLMVSVQGYTYCLDPATGEQLWSNPLKGFGLGVPSLCSMSGSSDPGSLLAAAAAAAEEQQHQAAG